MTRLSKIQKTILKVIRYYNNTHGEPITNKWGKTELYNRTKSYLSKPDKCFTSLDSFGRSLKNLEAKGLIKEKWYKEKWKYYSRISRKWNHNTIRRRGYILTKAGERKIS